MNPIKLLPRLGRQKGSHFYRILQMKDRLFISSVQKELAAERRALKDYVQGDPLLGKFFEVFLFEDVPARDRRADDLYLEEVDRDAIYIGLFGNEYGREDSAGLSATEREFDRASATNKIRLIFVNGPDDAKRHPKMQALVRKAGEQLIRRRFTGLPDLTANLYASLIEHLEQSGKLRTGPFDAAACASATIGDLSEDKVRQFLRIARQERQFALDENTSMEKALAHLNLLDHGQPNHAAILLFGREPQRFMVTSEVKCLHFHGTEVRKPIPSYQIYKGTVFDLVDQSVDFVLSKVARSVGTRERSAQAPVAYELPELAVREAIVNAIAHRDYSSNASVQVMLFADRLEVWNPGELPPSLSMERLRKPHASIPRNPLIADPLFLVRYVEKAGTGILDAISLCREAGLPEPEFRQDGGQFVMTLWRGWLTDEMLEKSDLSERQKQAIMQLKVSGKISNSEYQRLYGVTKPTASRDLDDLRRKGILKKVGTTGKGTYYTLIRKGLAKGSKGSSSTTNVKGSQRAQAKSPIKLGDLKKKRTRKARVGSSQKSNGRARRPRR
jgi:predicted HTH transcriptional regulator